MFHTNKPGHLKKSAEQHAIFYLFIPLILRLTDCFQHVTINSAAMSMHLSLCQTSQFPSLLVRGKCVFFYIPSYNKITSKMYQFTLHLQYTRTFLPPIFAHMNHTHLTCSSLNRQGG